jgi:hypothetical protein
MEGSPNKVATAYTKMFTPSEEKTASDDKNNKRWGDGKILQTRVSVEPNVYKQQDKQVTIRVAYEVHDTVRHPVFGILIKNATGAHILGTNSKIKLLDTGIMQAGDKGVIEWVLPNIFNDGKYFVTTAISHEDTVTQHDWTEDIVHFKVYREDRTAFIVNPHTEVSLRKQ